VYGHAMFCQARTLKSKPSTFFSRHLDDVSFRIFEINDVVSSSSSMVILSLLTDTSLKDLVINFIMFALYAPLIKAQAITINAIESVSINALIKHFSRLMMTTRIRLTD
jgi:hypothetical protein